MTDTERIATALLGWNAIPDRSGRGYRCYTHTKGGPPLVQVFGDGYAQLVTPSKWWPDLTTLDGCRLFEDALIVRGSSEVHRYISWLDALAASMPDGLRGAVSWREYQLWRASPEQRVAACIKVLDEAGL